MELNYLNIPLFKSVLCFIWKWMENLNGEEEELEDKEYFGG